MESRPDEYPIVPSIASWSACTLYSLGASLWAISSAEPLGSAQMYHPDKVAGLAPEFQGIPDRRMKEINAAYEVLKGRHDFGACQE